jgi:hypothetical protein
VEAKAFAHLGPLCFRQIAGIDVGAEIVAGKLMYAIDMIAEVGGELIGAKCGAFLDTNSVGQKQGQVDEHNEAPGGLALLEYFVAIRA